MTDFAFDSEGDDAVSLSLDSSQSRHQAFAQKFKSSSDDKGESSARVHVQEQGRFAAMMPAPVMLLLSAPKLHVTVDKKKKTVLVPSYTAPQKAAPSNSNTRTSSRGTKGVKSEWWRTSSSNQSTDKQPCQKKSEAPKIKARAEDMPRQKARSVVSGQGTSTARHKSHAALGVKALQQCPPSVILRHLLEKIAERGPEVEEVMLKETLDIIFKRLPPASRTATLHHLTSLRKLEAATPRQHEPPLQAFKTQALSKHGQPSPSLHTQKPSRQSAAAVAALQASGLESLRPPSPTTSYPHDSNDEPSVKSMSNNDFASASSDFTSLSQSSETSL